MQRWNVPRLVSTLATLAWLSAGPALAADFEHDVAPLFIKHCLECHDRVDPQGGLSLASAAGLRRGGESGRVVSPGDPESSYLLDRIRAGEMPPPRQGQERPLAAADMQIIRDWIAAGAEWPQDRSLSPYEVTTATRAGLDWWSLQPISRPAVPPLAPADTVATPIDAFIQARLQREGMQPAPPADRLTLLRRACFDLVGLPPTQRQVNEFLADQGANAFEKVIDELLASEHYGERWARYWLDLVRFAETCGYERDQLKPNIWRYRDWVVEALNADMPYDRFVTHQLAGDEIASPDENSVIATGMLRAGTWNDEPNDAADYLYERLEDMVHACSSAFLGLTVKCARCHDHKFDPIRQTDYYRLASFFWAGYIGQQNLGGPSPEQLGFDAFGWTDKGRDASPIHLLFQGERSRPGPVVEPGFLSAIPALDRPLTAPPASAQTTRRRLQFARWITDEANPLTARVIVNRLWLHHFGEGLVRTPNNFGFKGELPTHPQLLDWMAAELVAGGWRLKRLHKLIMLSHTYRQSSLHPREADYSTRDAQNRWLWRANRRRLDAEALRDAMLAASGQLNLAVGGPSFYPQMSPEALEGLSRKGKAWQHSPPAQRARRSIYMMTKRSRLLPLMTTFDFGNTTLPCGQRDVTTVAPQALALLNNAFVHRQSEAFARRLEREAATLPQQVDLAWRIALGRAPSSAESAAAIAHVQQQRQHFVAPADGPAATRPAAGPMSGPPADKLVLWLRADDGVELDDQRGIRFWRDRAKPEGQQLPHDASQADPGRRPRWVAKAIGRQPALRFDGENQFLHVAGQIVWSSQFSLFAVVSQQATGGGPREILSNWHRRGRSTTSLFLGTRGTAGVRFSDAMSDAGRLSAPEMPFILTAINSQQQATTYQDRRQLASAGPLKSRDPHGPYVIGTQGNYGSEWWHGDMAEILVYDRALGEDERQQVWDYLAGRYDLSTATTTTPAPKLLALASLCHVLLNTNEFIFVD